MTTFESLERHMQKTQTEKKIAALTNLIETSNQRIFELEKKLKTAKKTRSTLGQKMVILDFLGALDSVNELDIEQKSKIKILSYLLDSHEKSVEPAFNGRGKNLNSALSNKSNYSFLVRFFEEIGLPIEANKAEKKLQLIKSQKKR